MSRKELTDSLVQSLEMHPTAVFFTDVNGVIHFANKAGVSLFNSESETLSDTKLGEIIEERRKGDFEEFLKNAFDSPKPQKIRLKILEINGSLYEALLIAKPLKLSESTESFLAIAVVNISEIEFMGEMGKRSELRFENMANTAPVMIWIADVDGLFSFVNKVWLDYTGEVLGAQLGMNWIKNVYPDDQEKLLGVYTEAFNSRDHFSEEFRLKRMNGEYQWMLINGSPRVNEQGIFAGFIGSCININEQIKNEEKIKEINTQLIESNKTKDRFFSIISHDLRGPLGGLMQILEILAGEYNSLSEEEKQRLISDASVSAKGTYNLMENLLDWSRVQSGKMEYHPERIQLNSLVNDVASLYNQNLQNKKIHLQTGIEDKLLVFADKKMSETVLRNLISNAIKFTFPDGSISVEAEKKDDYVTLKVKDTGIGMSEESLEDLFRLDVSHSTRGTGNESGTGLGLILCKELVERQGGRIWVESRIDEGSTFYFTIPLAL